MTTPRNPTRKQAQQAAAALSGLLDEFKNEWSDTTTQRVTVALELTQQAAASPLPAQRSQLMATALLFLSPRAAADLLAQRKGGTP